MQKYPFTDIGIENINIEKDETALLPDGNLYEFDTNKKHSSGGQDVFAPNQTRIFSEKLKATPELSKEITGKNYRSEKSFAEISKLYDTTKYSDLMNNSKDDLTKRTAELMFNKLNGQLDNVFYAQETFKESKGIENNAAELSNKLMNGGKLQEYQTAGTVHQFPVPKQAQDLFEQLDYEFGEGALDPIDIPRLQRRNTDGTFGRTRDIEDFKRHNQWYFKDRPHFDTSDPEAVRRYQSTYNRELRKRYDPELAKQMQLVEDGKFGEATSRTTLPSRNLDIPNKLGQVELKPFQINSTFEHQMDLPQTEEKQIEKMQSVGIDPMALSDAMKMGIGLSELLSLRKSNPYYTGVTQKAALQRFNPMNTLANERAFNIQKENLSNVPEHVKQALLSQNQSKFQDGVNQVALNNFQNDNQVDNANTSAIINAYNQNANIRNQANYQYAQESAIRDNNYDLTREKLMERLFDLQDDKNYRGYSRELMSQLSRNYNVGRDGKVGYEQGSTADPTLVNPLASYSRGKSNSGLTSEQIAEMTTKELREYLYNN